MLLSKAWTYYEKDKKYQKYSPATLKSYGLHMKLFVRYSGDRDVKDYTYIEMKDYLSTSSERLKASSVITRIRFLKSFFRWAHEEGLTEKNEAARLKEPKLPKREPKPLTVEEIEGMRDACETPLERSIFEFFYATGCRVGEVVKVKTKDIDWNQRMLQVNGKGNKNRTVFFDKRCEVWLNKYLESRDDNQENLFVTEHRFKANDGEPRTMSIAQIRWVLKRVAKRAGIEKSIYPHNMRHSFAMNMLENGAPIEGIQELLGHEDQKYTRIYADLNTKMKRNIYERHHT